MDHFTEFVSSSVEFIVGGAMLLVTAVIWWACLAPGPGDLERLGRDLAVLPGSALTFGLFILSYAAGVIVESLSRMVFEPWLDDETRWRYWDLRPGQTAKPTSRKKARQAWKELDSGARDYKTSMARTEREKQRAAVMFTSHQVLYADVASQLRRLRLERVTSVCALGIVPPLVIDGRYVAAGCALLLFAVMAYLVRERCERYVNVIKRTYLQVLDSPRLEMKL